MQQILFRIPGLGLPIFGYGLMLFLAFLGSMQLAAWRARREGLDRELVLDLALYLFVGGLVGARLFYVIQKWGTQIHSVWEAFKIWEGGIVLYGSLIGAAVAFFLYRALRPFPLRPYLDCLAPSMALGVALGRIGCFLNGCCYGDLCEIPGLGVSFPAGSAPWDQQVYAGLIGKDAARSLPVHATQLYSALDGFLLLALLNAFYPLRRRDGEVMGMLLLAYPVGRFLIEYLRNDEPAIVLGMTISQAISALLLLGTLAYWGWLATLPKARWVDEHPPQAEPAAEGATPATA
ncbi:MAG: prolipoprotein diacylglyceryl transferase [Isosphaeraceae bacterium]